MGVLVSLIRKGQRGKNFDPSFFLATLVGLNIYIYKFKVVKFRILYLGYLRSAYFLSYLKVLIILTSTKILISAVLNNWIPVKVFC